jgi:aldehyde dehydrogenase (NAD+)
MEHPLAIYIFGKDKSQIETSTFLTSFLLLTCSLPIVIANTNSGGVTINDTFMHAGVPHAPFGGVGESGTGYYHGEHGITSFSHQRTIVGFPTWFHSLLSFRYPPYNYSKSIIVKNHLGFKKGETQEDQKIRKRGGSSNLLTLAIGVSVLANLYVLVENRSAVSNILFSNLKAVKERLL